MRNAVPDRALRPVRENDLAKPVGLMGALLHRCVLITALRSALCSFWCRDRLSKLPVALQVGEFTIDISQRSRGTRACDAGPGVHLQAPSTRRCCGGLFMSLASGLVGGMAAVATEDRMSGLACGLVQIGRAGAAAAAAQMVAQRDSGTVITEAFNVDGGIEHPLVLAPATYRDEGHLVVDELTERAARPSLMGTVATGSHRCYRRAPGHFGRVLGSMSSPPK